MRMTRRTVSMGVFHIVLEHGVKDLVRWKGVAVLLVGAQLGGGRLFERGLRNDGAPGIHIITEAIDQGFRYIGYDRKATDQHEADLGLRQPLQQTPATAMARDSTGSRAPSERGEEFCES